LKHLQHVRVCFGGGFQPFLKTRYAKPPVDERAFFFAYLTSSAIPSASILEVISLIPVSETPISRRIPSALEPTSFLGIRGLDDSWFSKIELAIVVVSSRELLLLIVNGILEIDKSDSGANW
jgi:hypothetical protein